MIHDLDVIRARIARARGSGDMFSLYDAARDGLLLDPDDADCRYLQTFALARLADPARTLELYERNRVGDIGDEDALALRGRLLKDLATQSPPERRAMLFRQSSQAYKAAAAVTKDGYFAAINAATTLFLAGDHAAAAHMAGEILASAALRADDGFFARVTHAEALLLRWDSEAAIAALYIALAADDANLGARTSTTRQLALILAEMRLPRTESDALMAAVRPPPVIHFSGHMFYDGWTGEQALRSAVDRVLAEADIRIGYGSLACGSDIVIAEALLARGGELHVVLPFDEASFIATSVHPGGETWLPRYYDVRTRAASSTLATLTRTAADDRQFAYGAQLAMGLARLRARSMETSNFQLAVWDGTPSTGIAGTAADVAEWRKRGGETYIIDSADAPRVKTLSERIDPEAPRRIPAAILFADFAGFSRLAEDRLPRFVRDVLGKAARCLDALGGHVLARNSWGDAIFSIIDTPQAAAAAALDIQDVLTKKALVEAGLPEDGGMRIGLHYGPVFDDVDPVQGRRSFHGTEVTLAARIEPRVPIGAIYATQTFVALADPGHDAPYRFDYVGTMHLAKNYGERTLYRLVRRTGDIAAGPA